LCAVVVVVGVLFVAGLEEEELAALPPHAAITTVLARVATSISIAVSGVLFMGRAPNLARGLGDSPYQPLVAPIAVV
jgi:hypothetical protein